MPIHHSIAKKALAAGCKLSLDEEAETVTAHMVEANVRVTLSVEDISVQPAVVNDTAKDAWVAADAIATFHGEHASIRIRQEDGDFVAFAHAKGKDGEEIARDPDLDDLFVTLAEQPEEDEPEETGSVVPDHYKKLYAERGDASNCGDWLALTLASLIRVHNEKGREVSDLDRLEAIATANGVEASRFGRMGVETNGWQGRYRMTVRNLLTPLAAAKGFLFVPEGCGRDADSELTAPPAWCAEHTSKTKLKEAARKEAPTAAAVQSQPGAGKRGKAKAAKIDGVAEATKAVRAAKAKELARKGGN